MKHRNDVILAGPVSRVTERMFGDFGFLEMNLAAVKVKFGLKTRDKRSMALPEFAKTCRSAVLYAGSFNTRQDKKDLSKWWYTVSGRVSGVAFLQTEVPILNHAEVVGTVRSVANEWMYVACRYLIPGRDGQKATYGENCVWVLCPHPAESYIGKEVLAVGSARPRVGAEWQLHLAAEGIWPLN